jgi:hypothetical protein
MNYEWDILRSFHEIGEPYVRPVKPIETNEKRIEALEKRVQELEDASWRNGWESK